MIPKGLKPTQDCRSIGREELKCLALQIPNDLEGLFGVQRLPAFPLRCLSLVPGQRADQRRKTDGGEFPISGQSVGL